MPYRVSLRHVQQAGIKTAGWSDNFWSNQGSDAAVEASTTLLASALNQVIGSEAYIPSYRYSVADAFRNAQNRATGFRPQASGVYSADYPTVALLLRLTAPGPYVVNQWIRGIPDNVVDAGGKYNPGGVAGFLGLLNTFLGLLTATGENWCLRVLSRAVLPKPITTVALGTGLVTVPAHGFGANGDIIKIRIKGSLIPRGLNKVWQATIIDGANLQLSYYVPPTDPNLRFYAIAASARLQTYVYVNINSATIIRATAHYTGRPTELLGGRRRNRANSRRGQPVAV